MMQKTWMAILSSICEGVHNLVQEHHAAGTLHMPCKCGGHTFTASRQFQAVLLSNELQLVSNATLPSLSGQVQKI